MLHEVSRTEELAKRRRVHRVDRAGLEVGENRAWYVLVACGLVAKHVDAVELRVIVAAILAVAADAVLFSQHLLKLGAHLVTALARLHVHNFTR
jgi:Flp pilus assembly protein TadB